jgi:Rad3-related DNA helicase
MFVNLNYINRNNEQMIEQLGQFLLESMKDIPEGMVVFFTSYSIMKSYLILWNKCKISNKIHKIKKIFMEKKNKAENELEIEGYTNHYKKGALMMAVMGGKFSGII